MRLERDDVLALPARTDAYKKARGDYNG
jgi:hypothetical protein